MKTSLFFK